MTTPRLVEPFETDDPADRRYALAMTGILGRFNASGVLEASDVHTAARIRALADEPDDEVALALAFVVRQLRHGSVCLDLGALTSDPLPHGLTWPATGWGRRVADSRIGSAGVLRVEGDLAYLDRYWREECQVRDDLVARLGLRPPPADAARLARLAPVLFPEGVRRAASRRARGSPGLDHRRDRGARHRQDDRGRRAAGPARRRLRATPADRAHGPHRQGRGPAPGGGGRGAAQRGAPRPRGPRRAARGPDAPPAPRVEARQPQPVPPRPPQPPASRRDRGRRDVDGVADDDGPAAGGGAPRLPAGPGR